MHYSIIRYRYSFGYTFLFTFIHLICVFYSYENGRITKKGEDENGQCGITVNYAKDADNGRWECIISAQGADGSLSVNGFVDVVVAGSYNTSVCC